MKFNVTGGLVIIALVLGALVFFVERPLRLARERRVVRDVLPGLDPKQVSSIEVSPAGQIIRAERAGHSWQLTKPIFYPADAERVDALVGALADLKWSIAIGAEELKDRPDAQESFGFDKPIYLFACSRRGRPSSPAPFRADVPDGRRGLHSSRRQPECFFG